MPLIEIYGTYASTQVKKVLNSGFAQMVPLWKWRRQSGIATFVRDMIDLRKTIALCHSCEMRMPSRWLNQYSYELLRGYYPDNSSCDYCRDPCTTVNLFVPGDGPFFQEYDRAQRGVRASRTQVQKVAERDPVSALVH